MDKSCFLSAWSDLPESAKRMFKTFAKHPTERNSACAVGYIAALMDSHLISTDTYRYWLVAAGQLGELGDNDLVLTIKEAL